MRKLRRDDPLEASVNETPPAAYLHRHQPFGKVRRFPHSRARQNDAASAIDEGGCVVGFLRLRPDEHRSDALTELARLSPLVRRADDKPARRIDIAAAFGTIHRRKSFVEMAHVGDGEKLSRYDLPAGGVDEAKFSILVDERIAVVWPLRRYSGGKYGNGDDT